MCSTLLDELACVLKSNDISWMRCMQIILCYCFKQKFPPEWSFESEAAVIRLGCNAKKPADVMRDTYRKPASSPQISNCHCPGGV